MVKMLTVLISTISNPQVFLLKNVSSFCKCKCKSYSHFFSKNISVCAIINDQSFNDALTNDIVSFEQLGPDQPGHKQRLIRLIRACNFSGNKFSSYLQVRLAGLGGSVGCAI